jgi:hypothetical protein
LSSTGASAAVAAAACVCDGGRNSYITAAAAIVAASVAMLCLHTIPPASMLQISAAVAVYRLHAL